mgnify:CR=1 FL=1
MENRIFNVPLIIFLSNNWKNRMLAYFYIPLKWYEPRRTQKSYRGQLLYASPGPVKKRRQMQFLKFRKKNRKFSKLCLENHEEMLASGSTYFISTQVSAPFNHKAPFVFLSVWESTNGIPPYNAIRSFISNWKTSKLNSRYGSSSGRQFYKKILENF